MNVSPDNIAEVIQQLSRSTQVGLDTETYGLEYDDRMFSLALATTINTYYFNFYGGADFFGEYSPIVLDRYSTLYKLSLLFEDHEKEWFIHNASYDLQKLSYEGVELAGTVTCTKVSERLLYNDLGPKDYSLAKCAQRRGLHKIDLVEEFISKNKLYTHVFIPGKKKRITRKHFEKVNFTLLSLYAQQDALLHLQIGLDQRKNNVFHI